MLSNIRKLRILQRIPKSNQHPHKYLQMGSTNIHFGDNSRYMFTCKI